MGRHLGIDFYWILVDFWRQVGTENRAKRGQDRPRQRKTREAKGREGKGKEEEGKGLEGKGVEKCGSGLFSPGGRGSPDR